jgi:hypothetical protein
MKPLKIGRVLGIGLRVAGRIAGQRLAGGAQPVAPRPQPATLQAHAAGHVAGQATAQTGRGIAKGVGGFLRPFGRVGGIVWLEVTGVFFFLFVAVFARALWFRRTSWAHGPDHKAFLGSAALMLVFLYLGISAFWRARRK